MDEVLLEFVERVGKDPEFSLFKGLYRGLSPGKFAVVKVSGKSLENHLDEVAEDLAFLSKAGIFPAVVFGAGSLLDKAFSSEKVSGSRVTGEKDMQLVKNVFEGLGKKLAGKVVEKGGKAEFVEGVFECDLVKGLGSVGKVKEVNISAVEKVLDKKAIPIICPVGKCLGKEVNVNADNAAKELVKVLKPKKFILLTETGGILDKEGKVLPFINLSSDTAFEGISGGMLAKARELKDFLDEEKECEAVITSPKSLLKEIFTVKGEGTLVKSHSIVSKKGFGEIDKARVKNLLENSFGKKLVKGYFDQPVLEVFFQEDFEGIAVVQELNGLPYLDKFSVEKQYQGTGLGKSLWDAISKKFKKLVWRAPKDSKANNFYARNCDGFAKKEKWNVYWLGLEDQEIAPAVKVACSKQSTMLP